MSKLGWGVVGIGRIVNTTMAPAMVAEPNMEVVAGVSRSQERAEAFAKEFGASHAYTDYDQMLANPDVDAVFIATPNAFHADQVVAAAKAGKHVLCDKPLATNIPDALRAYRACQEAGVKMGINFHNRRLQWVIDTRQMISEGRIGDIDTIQIEASAGNRPMVDWRTDRSLAGMGTVYNQGVHVFDFLRYVLGSDPVQVFAIFDDEGKWEVESQALILMEFDNGVKAYLNINSNTPYPQNNAAFYGSKGRITADGLTRSRFDGELTTLTEDGETTTPYPQPSGEAHRKNVAAFATAVLAGEEPNASGMDGIYSVILCDAMARSATEGCKVAIDYGSILADVR